MRKLEDNPHVKIGVLEKSEKRSDGADNLTVAASNEFGVSISAGRSGGQIIQIPERSFIRSNHDEKKAKYWRKIKRMKRLILGGRITVEAALKAIGAEVQGDVRKKIVNLKEPPNAPATIERKKSSNPLVDTGQLQGAIDFELGKDG